MFKRPIVITLGLLVAAVAPLAASAVEPAAHSRQGEVAHKGASVMPFDLGRTTHFFDDTPTGGIESVTANDARDGAQIGLIRSHLREEAKRFARGDFSDPAQIHGEDMPGLRTLANAGPKLKITYDASPAGGSITFLSRDPQIVSAVHAWFEAQRTDHGAHEHMHHQ